MMTRVDCNGKPLKDSGLNTIEIHYKFISHSKRLLKIQPFSLNSQPQKEGEVLTSRTFPFQ